MSSSEETSSARVIQLIRCSSRRELLSSGTSDSTSPAAAESYLAGPAAARMLGLLASQPVRSLAASAFAARPPAFWKMQKMMRRTRTWLNIKAFLRGRSSSALARGAAFPAQLLEKKNDDDNDDSFHLRLLLLLLLYHRTSERQSIFFVHLELPRQVG